jgi:hypothetical protein
VAAGGCPYASNTVSVDAALATIHPSAVLRARSSDDLKFAFTGLMDDLRITAGACAS